MVGANGVGKSTLLRLLAGFHIVPEGQVRVLGSSPFHDGLSRTQVCLVDSQFPLNLDISIRELLGDLKSFNKREDELYQLLEINNQWRMHRVSDGERRRVQLFLALRQPVELLLLDEVTANLDLLVRSDLLNWLKKESIKQKMTILYTTHILDGLWGWPTHFLFLQPSKLKICAPIHEIVELKSGPSKSNPTPFLKLSQSWMKAGQKLKQRN